MTLTSCVPQLIVQVGPTEHVICALSGGVDSTVAATLVHKVLGDRLHCVFVDNGLLRYKVRRAAVCRPLHRALATQCDSQTLVSSPDKLA